MISPELLNLQHSFILRLILFVLSTILCVVGAHRYLYRYVTSRREPREALDRITVFADYEEVHLDIVAVHGLGAHPYYSWKANAPPNSTGVPEEDEVGINWLEHDDFLKKDFKNVRILSYSYNADWFVDASLSTASQKALTFLETLSEFREKTKKTPPILFIGHSFGGILVKYAIHSAHSDSRFGDISRDTAGILFLGTPHQGSTVSWIGEILARLTILSGSDTTLLKLLSHGSSALLDLKRDFSAAVTSIINQKPLLVYSFYETLPTFRYGVSLGVIVGPQSATLDIGKHIPVNTDHSGLNKCKTRKDDLYVKICSAIQNVKSILQQQSEPIARWIMGSDDPARIFKHRVDHERARDKLRAYDNIGKWLIESPEFVAWSDIQECTQSTFWLRGGVGTGKTSVSSEVIEWFYKDNRLRRPRKVVYVYCSIDHDFNFMLRSLILQLAFSANGVSVQQCITERYNSRGRAQQLVLDKDDSKLILELCRAHPEIVIIIDALDECPASRHVLDTFKNVQEGSSNKIKLFLSSRLHMGLDDVFTNLQRLTIEENTTRMDLEHYINKEIDSRRNTPPGWIRMGFKDRFKRALSQYAQGVFRWVELQVEIFFDESFPFELEEDVESELRNLEKGQSITGHSKDQMAKLNEAYDRILKKRRQNARSIITYALKWVLCSLLPLTSGELFEAVTLSHERMLTTGSYERHETIDLNQIMRLCSNLILFTDYSGFVRFSHNSVKEYLMNSEYCNDEFVYETCHGFVAEICLWYIYRRGILNGSLGSYIQLAALSHCSRAGPDNRRRQGLHDLLRSFCEQPLKALDRKNIGKYYLSLYEAQDRLATSFNHLAHAFIAACVFNLNDILELALTREATDFAARRALRRKGLKAACIYDSYEVVMELLNGREPVEVTAGLVKAAITYSSGRVITLILRNYDNMVITPDMTTCATKNRQFGVEVLKALKNHYGRLPADIETYRSAMGCSSEMLKYLLAGVDHPPGIEDIVALASSGREESMSTVLHSKEDIPITQSVLLGAARNSVDGHQIMKTLVEHTKANIVLSEEILCAVASNKHKGPMIFEYLFRALGNSVNITEGVLVSAAKSGWLLDDLINILKRRPDIPIPEAIISDAVSDEFHGDEFIEALFNHDPNIAISEDSLVAAAQNNGRGTKIVSFLIRHIEGIKITPRVVAAAAANKSLGNELVPLLLAGILDLHIEDTVLEAAAGNSEFGDELVEALLYYGGAAPIGDGVMEAVARNKKRGVRVFALLLEHDPNIKISESMLKAAVFNGNSKLLKVWLDRSDANSRISEAVVKEAIHDFSTLLVLLRSGRRITITPDILKLAATNRHVTEIFPTLLDYDKRCPITEAVLTAAIGNPNLFGRHVGSSVFTSKFSKLLDRARVGVTEDMVKLAAGTDWRRRHVTKILLEYQDDLDVGDVLEIAAGNDSYTQEMFEFLLECDEDYQITEDVVIAAARSSGGSMRALLKCGRHVPITEAVLKTVASRKGWDAASDMALILNGGYGVEITEGVMQAARGSGTEEDEDDEDDGNNEMVTMLKTYLQL
ncbi:hypothetical protein F5Y00DRAFT_274251 [Daldinia vernicosa]|uniref:uncharacterized protein n=1 Tax=Daldinia vernicosa TaxID=114800 RepID=UPI0020076494|nr:uncharacterized protein F5Y00DRAFT_274251 [Daldinia vernicosa]KAI0852003.1 hypothetical protein F5Y00DRAFT_274251 [Daldinia vernicosa]